MLGTGARGATERANNEYDDPITLVGLVFESAAGLRRKLAPTLGHEIGVGGQAFDLLVRLARTRGQRLRMSDLAAQASLTPSGLSRSVDRLVALGLVVRESCPDDRRGTNVRLTGLGASTMATALERHCHEVDDLLAELFTPAECVELATLLRRLRDRVHPEATLVSDTDDSPLPDVAEMNGDCPTH